MDWAPGPSEVSLTFGAAGLAVVAPLPGGHYRVVATVDDAPADPDLAFVAAAAGRAHPRPGPGHRSSSGPPASASTTGSPTTTGPAVCCLAGDAAHVHSPAGGQGMNTGIQDGYALGRAFATGELDGYEAQRRPIAQRVVAFTDRMTRIATTRNAAVRGVRNIALPLLGRLPACPRQARHRARRAQLQIARATRATGDVLERLLVRSGRIVARRDGPVPTRGDINK